MLYTYIAIAKLGVGMHRANHFTDPLLSSCKNLTMKLVSGSTPAQELGNEGHASIGLTTPYVNFTSAGSWSSPPTTGPRPPPCSAFSFTAINDHQAVFFGGNQSEKNQPGFHKLNDCYLMDFESMVCPESITLQQHCRNECTVECSCLCDMVI